MCYGAADGTGKGESGVEGDTAELARGAGSSLLDDGVDLGRAGGLRGGAHCDEEELKTNNDDDKRRMEWRMQLARC